MPYLSTKIRLPRHLDRRVKLSDEQKADIIKLFDSGVAIREIARQYQKICSRRLIQLVIYPERRAIQAKQFKENRKDGRYKPTKEKWREQMKEHRHYKQQLKLNKII